VAMECEASFDDKSSFEPLRFAVETLMSGFAEFAFVHSSTSEIIVIQNQSYRC